LYETGSYLFEGYHTNQLPSAMHGVNVALCIAASYTGYGFWAAGLHGPGSTLVITEIGWLGMQEAALLHSK
jgi:hypothetical protein